MKVKCINCVGLETLLTLGKEYTIKNVTDRFFIIENDRGLTSRYDKDRFVVVTAKKEEVALIVHDGKLEENKIAGTEEFVHTYLDFTEEAVVTKEEEPLMETLEFEAKGLNEAMLGAKVVGDYETIGTLIGKLVDTKNAEYGDAINSVDKMLEILYPNGIALEQYKNASVLVRILDKVFRIAHGNKGSENAWNDIGGYSILMSKEKEDK